MSGTSDRARPTRRVLLSVVTLVTAGSAVAGSYSYGATSTSDPVIVAAGDIACAPGGTVSSTACQQPAVGKLVQSLNPVTVLPLGDTQYDTGTSTEYANSYDVSGWGAEKGISRPAVGNHEYRTTNAAGYYGYFGANAGDPSKGYYSYDVTGPNNSFRWHLIALNSECASIGGGSTTAGCGVGSPQEQWLKADLAAHPDVCTLAYFHRPRFSSGATVGSSSTYTAFWNDLYAAGADLILNGHAHHYERFAPQTSSGALDTAKGIREFIVGTGGKNFQSLSTPVANSVVRNNSTFGVLKLTLHAAGYDWQFVPVPGSSFTDSGSASCHSAATRDTTAPSAPANLAAGASGPTRVDLQWTASTDNVGVSNYRIYRGANGATPSVLATTSTAGTSWSDTSAQASTTYTYQVSALDAAGNESAPSSPATATTPASADTTPPTAPGSPSAEVISGSEIDIGWAASSDTGTGVAGYKVYREKAGDSSFTLVGTTTGTALGYADTTVSPGTSYAYYVTAYDGAGNESAPSAAVTATTPSGSTSQTFTFPAAADATIDQTNATTNYGLNTRLQVDASPVDDFLVKFSVATSGCASVSSATLQLTDTDGSPKGGDFYTTGSNWTEGGVTWATAPTRGTLLNSLGAVAAGSTYQVDVTNGVSPNGDVSFRVSTTSKDGARYYSRQGGNTSQKPLLTVVCATGTTTTDTQAPTAPTSLTANAASSSEVDLSWGASTDNVGVTGYKVFRSDSTTEIGTVSGSSLSYQDTTVSAGTTYSYTVRAFDAAGNLSPASNTATATAGSATPAAPNGLQAAATANQVTLTWTPSADATVTGYNVYRGPHGGALANIGSSATASYTDSNVPDGTYDYAVTAVATGGAESAKSSIATVTVGSTGSGTSTSQTFTFTAAGDATIDKTNATTNYGSDTRLIVDNSPVYDFLLGFNVATTGCTSVTSATLTVTDGSDGSVKGGDFYSAGPFTESTVTWATAPARGALLGSLGAVANGTSYTLDVTPGVTTLNGEVDFRAGSTSSDGAHYYSKEGAGTTTSRAPTLTVVCS